MFTYDVDLHTKDGWDTYQVSVDCLENARYNAIMRLINETGENEIDYIKIYKHGTDKLLKEYEN